MSISQKELTKVTDALKKGDYTKIAEKISRSQPWVSKVLGSLDLANKNLHIITAALEVIEQKNDQSLLIKQRIQEVTA